MSKAQITVKQQHNNGDFHEVEVFFIHGGIIIHRHLLTGDEKEAELFTKYRKFWNKWYTQQEVAILFPELKKILIELLKHPFEAIRMWNRLK